MRLARLYSLGILGSFGLLTLIWPDAEPRELTRLVRSALESASCVVAGLSAWATASDFESEDVRDGFALLASVHGVGAKHLEYSRSLAAALRAVTGIALPALGIIALGALKTAAFAWAITLSLGCLGYALALGVALVLLARVAALVANTRGRALLACFLGALEILHLANPKLPSFSSVFGASLSELARVGGSFG